METTESNGPLFSSLADDPDLQDLLEEFVARLPGRAEEMRIAFEGGDRDRLKTLAHQLKGAAGSYGFSPITDVCRDLEESVRDGGDEDTIREALGAVVDLCERATHLASE